MKLNYLSKYSNYNPPFKDKKWVYNDSLNTNIYDTWLKHGLLKKFVSI
jgi:hypothetical protein